MSHLTVGNAGRRGGATGEVKGGWDLGPKWMEETRDGVRGVAAVEWSEFHRYASLASNQRMSEKLYAPYDALCELNISDVAEKKKKSHIIWEASPNQI